MSKSRGKRRISRRKFLEGTGAALVVAAEAPTLAGQENAKAQPTGPRTSIRLTVNGKTQRLQVEDRWTLVEVLRDHLMLTGTKIGCDRGECGACTVIANGKPVYSCSQLAVWMDGKSIETVEGLAKGEQLDPVQKAFIEHDAPQCGFCTSGQVMSAKALLSHNPRPTREEVQAGLTGNICRCSAYNRYVEATLAAASGAAVPTGGTAQFVAAAGAPLATLQTAGHPTPRIDARSPARLERSENMFRYCCRHVGVNQVARAAGQLTKLG